MRVTKSGIYLALWSAVLAVIATVLFIPRADARPRSAVKAGDKALAFQAETIGGQKVVFPDDYKGKVVLLDFWATWCEDCAAELPNVVATYQKDHAKGFEILGVSLDDTNQSEKLLRFVKENDMPWPEIYDGGYWAAAVAVKYGVIATPCPVLVDGDTGLVLGAGAEVTGPGLARRVETALAAKNKK